MMNKIKTSVDIGSYLINFMSNAEIINEWLPNDVEINTELSN